MICRYVKGVTQLFHCFCGMNKPLFCRDTYPMLLVANKVDLVHLRKVTEESGRDLAMRLGIPYIETSAKDPPLNVDAAFHEVCELRNFERCITVCVQQLVLIVFFYFESFLSIYLFSGGEDNP